MGWYRPLAQRPTEVVYAALDQYGAALVEDDDLGDRALQIASAHERIPLEDAELLGLIRDERATASRRVAALRALETRPGARAAAGAAAGTALDTNAPLLRAEARDVLIRLQSSRAFAAIEVVDDRSSLIERQRAYASLARLGTPEADARLAVALERLQASSLPTAVQLELIEAVESRDDPVLRGQLDAWRASRGTNPITRYSWALDGGDPLRGELVFQGSGDCQRCHGTAGHGAGIGPALIGIAAKRGTLHLLSSMLVPQADIAEGFGTISLTRRDGSIVTGALIEQREHELLLRVAAGELVKVALADIASRTEPTSSMPPVGLALADRDLRDVIAYLKTL
jgi:quinoprotein glucose dehydrogenase